MAVLAGRTAPTICTNEKRDDAKLSGARSALLASSGTGLAAQLSRLAGGGGVCGAGGDALDGVGEIPVKTLDPECSPAYSLSVAKL